MLIYVPKKLEHAPAQVTENKFKMVPTLLTWMVLLSVSMYFSPNRATKCHCKVPTFSTLRCYLEVYKNPSVALKSFAQRFK